MADIKTREHSRDIKVLDKSAIAGERMKNAFVRSKEQAKNLGNDNDSSPTEYAENRVQYAVESTVSEVGYEAKHQVDKYVEKGRNAYREHRQERRAEKKSQKVNEALKRYDPDFDSAHIAPKSRLIKEAETMLSNKLRSQRRRLRPLPNL